MNAKKVEELKKTKLTVKVISITDYMPRAREEYGVDNIWNNALALLYSENKVIQVLNRKGEDKFVCEI